jgi:hypothetical protein
MRNHTRIALTVTAALWIQTAQADPLTDAYEAAPLDSKLVLCAPLLVKQGGIIGMIAARKAASGDASGADKTWHAAFNIQYRGETLQALARSTNPTLLDNAWKLSADDIGASTYSALTQSCVALYNEHRVAGKIPADIETQAIDKVRHNMTDRSNEAAISPGCRGKAAKADLCAQARAYADDSARLLPMRVSQNLTISTIFAAGKRITMTAVLAYDRQYLESLAGSNGASMQAIESAMITTARTGACAPGAVRDFIDNGGSVQYLYRFRNGAPYLNPVVSRCP